MKTKIIKLVAFCTAVTLLIFMPAIFNLISEAYLNITMKSTGKLPTINTYEKLEKLTKDRKYEIYQLSELPPVRYINDMEPSVRGAFEPSSFNNVSMGAMESAPIRTQTASNYSSTNVQVAGVDEADILKNDGKYIYMISKNKLVIVDAFPADSMQKLSEVEIEEGYRAIDLYISGNKLLLVTDNYNSKRYNSNIQTKVIIFDVTDKSNPKDVSMFEFTGTYTSSRKLGEKIYVFSNLRFYKQRGEYIIPKYKENNASDFTEVNLTDIQYVPNDDYTSYTQIFAFDIGTPLNSPKIVTYLGSSANNIYMSQNNLYMAQSKYFETAIYKFSLNSEYPRYECRGAVPGTIVNQFAMDEYEDNFRIATTKNNKSGVYVLSKSMHRLGSVGNIAPRETIKSVRFEGNRAYVVTFRNTDPLFVIDLSKVRAPKVLGELKIPGYSTYLHPYDEKHVIGFGYDGTEMGTNGKLKIALFDITDVKFPKEKFNTKINASTSELLTNHKSLLFSKEKNLIAFSVGDYRYWRTGRKSKIGKVYTISLDRGFTLRGDIEHESVDITRMLFMDDILYGVSEESISAHDINTIEELNRIDI